jgi:hypothetical protein
MQTTEEPPARRNQRRLQASLAMQRSQRLLTQEIEETLQVLDRSIESISTRWLQPLLRALNDMETHQQRRNAEATLRAMVEVCRLTKRFVDHETRFAAIEQTHARHASRLMRLCRRVSAAGRIAIAVLDCVPGVRCRDATAEVPSMDVRAKDLDVVIVPVHEHKRRPDTRFLLHMTSMLTRDAAGLVSPDDRRRAGAMCNRVRTALTRLHERYILRTSRLRREGAKLTRFVEEACARITEARIASLPQHRPVILYD